MRKILFKGYTPFRFDENGKRIENTGKVSETYNEAGVFHQWAADFEEFETGPGNYTVALVELPNGEIQKILPDRIKFID